MLRGLYYGACIIFICMQSNVAFSQSAGAQNSDWLTTWLSGPLPGQPVKSVPLRHAAQTRVVQWPVPPRQRRLTNRRQTSGHVIRQPSLKGKPGERPRALSEGAELPGMHLGIGIVKTSGTTDWNHDASSASATLGNPSSELTYEDDGTVVLELDGRMQFERGYFIRGNLGIGATFGAEGNLRDDDFLAGQTLFSSTDSAIPDTDIFYLTVDVGKEIINIDQNRISVSLFTGFQYWREEHEATGLFNLLTNQQTRTSDVSVISNVVEWKSFRLGALGTYKPNERMGWTFDLAFVPYTAMHNEDSHLLRTAASSLGPAPNVIMDGSGFGFEGAVGFIYALTSNWVAVVDFRYWQLMSDGDITLGPEANSTSTFPLNDLNTVRYGFNAGLRYVF